MSKLLAALTLIIGGLASAAEQDRRTPPAMEPATGPMPVRAGSFRWPVPSEAEVVETLVVDGDRRTAKYRLCVGHSDLPGEFLWWVEHEEFVEQPKDPTMFVMAPPDEQPMLRVSRDGIPYDYADPGFMDQRSAAFPPRKRSQTDEDRERQIQHYANLMVNKYIGRFSDLSVPTRLPSRRGDELLSESAADPESGARSRHTVIRHQGPVPGRPNATRYTITEIVGGKALGPDTESYDTMIDVDDTTGRPLAVAVRGSLPVPGHAPIRTERRYAFRWKTLAEDVADIRKRGVFGRYGAPADRSLPAVSDQYEVRFPPSAVRQRQSGTARVRLAIDEKGAVSAGAIVESSGTGALDDEAIRLVRASRFHPALRNGRPVGSLVDITVEFTVTDDVP